MLKVNLKRRSLISSTEYKACPYCGGRIVKAATKCRYCQSSLGKWERAKPYVELISFCVAAGVLVVMALQLKATYQVLDLKEQRKLLSKDIAALEERKELIEKDIVVLITDIRQYTDAWKKAALEMQLLSQHPWIPEMPSLSEESKEVMKRYHSTIRDSTNQYGDE